MFVGINQESVDENKSDVYNHLARMAEEMSSFKKKCLISCGLKKSYFPPNVPCFEGVL